MTKRLLSLLLVLLFLAGMAPPARAADAQSKDVAVFVPYEGNKYEDIFSDAYIRAGQAIAAHTGGTCTVYLGQEATIDAIAHAVETCDVVIVNTHGGNDFSEYYSVDDQVAHANTSYLTILNGEGITDEETAWIDGPHGRFAHAYRSTYQAYEGEQYNFDYYGFDGTALVNHITQPVKCRIFWMACCAGMLTDGLERPLREAGVEVVFGYAFEVGATEDDVYGPTFFSRMCAGDTVEEAARYADEHAAVTHDKGCYATFVTPEDPYLGQGNIYSVQIPHSSLRLLPTHIVQAETNDSALGTVTVNNTTITAVPAEGCAIKDYHVLSGTAAVRQDGQFFQVTPETDCTVQIEFEAKTRAVVRFETPEGVSCGEIPSYVGDAVTLPEPEGAPELPLYDYQFYAWSESPVSDTGERPVCHYAGTELTLAGDTTLYALYTYRTDDPALVNAGTFRKLTAEPADWTGEVLLTYNGTTVLDASGNYVPRLASAAKSLDAAGITADGDMLRNVSDAFVYVIEPVAGSKGVYSIRMKNSAEAKYLIYSSRENCLSTNSTPEYTTAHWTLSWKDGVPELRNVKDTNAVICFNPASGNFNCYNLYIAESRPLTLYVDASGQVRYTTELLQSCRHQYVLTERVEPTCEADGKEVYVCTLCGEEKTETLPQLWHDYRYVVTEPTCTEEGYTTCTCTRCGDTHIYNYTDPLGHRPERRGEKAAACTEPGCTGDLVCAVCGEVLEQGEAIPATGHRPERRGEKAAACTEPGCTGDLVCAVCGEVLEQGEAIPATGHSWGDWEVTEPATVTEEGTETRTCTACGAKEFRSVPKLTPSGWWQREDGKWFFYENGEAVTGWKKVNNVWYYFDDGGVMQTGWHVIGGAWYHFAPGGAMQTGWQKISNVWYYFAPGGQMQTGWREIGGKWYYLKPSGAMAANEWCNGWWLNADGSWTYPYKGSWKQNSTGWWFGDESGWYAKSETVRINDVYYTFNAAGYMV